MSPRLVVMVHAVRTEREKRAYTLLFDRLRADGATFTVITWDRGKSVLDLDALGPVGDIEDVNRWRLPIWLAKHRMRSLARRLRHARIRLWWARARGATSVLVLGLVRPEMAHYLPPGAHVGVLLGWRGTEDPESIEATMAIADTVVALDEDTAERCRLARPGVDVRTYGDLWPRLRWSLTPRQPPTLPRRLGIDDRSALVLGMGPIEWRGGADQFVAVAGRVGAERAGRPVEYAWIGGHPEGPSFHPYRFDVNRLGLAGRFHWLGQRDDYSELVRRADAVVVCCREPFASPFDPIIPEFAASYVVEAEMLEITFTPPANPLPGLLSLFEMPVAGFDLAAVDAVTGGLGTRSRYPDTAGLANAVIAALEDPPPSTAERALAHLLGPGVPQ